jgi:asparagine synthase (glutamine-hydrolysing)
VDVDHDLRALKRMSDVISHRGPDAEGQMSFDQRIFLGHRRLSIIDLSTAANQPLSNEDGSIWIVYNGEVYNFMDFRPRLLAKGHTLKSSGDTETLVHLYEDLGVEMLNQLNGMFAFAIWDSRQQLLFCARDEFGIKPFYYTELRDGLAFGSEIKALLALPEVKTQLDRLAFWQNMSFRYVPGDRTLFAGIRKLLPGHYLTWRPGGTMQVRRWCQRGAERRPNNGHRVQPHDVRATLQTAVQRQMVADVPVGSFLSGGLDSSLATAMMCKTSAPMREVRTYTVGYTAADLPERNGVDRVDYIDALAERYPLERRIIPPVIDPNEFLNQSMLRKIIWHLEEPVFDSALVNAIRIAEAARQDGTPVLLCGHGADELYGGYRRHKAATLLGLTRCIPNSVLRTVARLGKFLPADSYRLMHFLEISSLARPKDLISISFLNSLGSCRRVLSPDFVNGYTEHEAMSYHLGLLDEYDAVNTVDEALHLDQWTYLVDQNLLYMDKMSMAYSIESRVPYLDKDLFQQASTIPTSQLVTRKKLKAILHEAAEPLLPETILNRPKSGFGILYLYDWWTGQKSDWYEGLFRGATRRGWYEPSALAETKQRAATGDARASELLFSVLLSEVWAQCYLDAA